MISYECLHHVSLPVTDLNKAVTFYRDVLCLAPLERPDFDFDGAWFGVGEQQIHLIVYDQTEMLREQPTIDTKEAHFALRVQDYEETLSWLQKHNVAYRENRTSRSGFAQIFCLDPDGNQIELHVEQKKDC
ncbi:VOC family protein [Halalkalibacterium halodurans]|uniref:VOC family protein n=1 Tax=Halalkalibacterium halodurans TaxID=86665 RepID=UPI002E1AE43E|nr:VOC family protein [Halalkalibacterium halodurans]